MSDKNQFIEPAEMERLSDAILEDVVAREAKSLSDEDVFRLKNTMRAWLGLRPLVKEAVQ